MQHTIIKSPLLVNKFKLIRIQCDDGVDVSQAKDDVLDKMNEYLERNDGKLVNVKIIAPRQILVYFVIDAARQDQFWFETLKAKVLPNYKFLSSYMVIEPS